jgi:hypothetical protein
MLGRLVIHHNSVGNHQLPTGKNIVTDADLLHYYLSAKASSLAESAVPGITAYESSGLSKSTPPVSEIY